MMMVCDRGLRLQLCLVGTLLVCATSAFAQATAPPASPPSSSSTQQAGDDDRRPSPAEPDYRVINIPTTLRLPLHASNFEMTHRFGGNLLDGSFGYQASNLFGLDQGAAIGLGYRYGILPHVQVGFVRTSVDKTIQFHGKWDAIHQHDSMPLSISAVLSIEGANNFQERRAPAIGASVGRTIKNVVAAYATPIWVHNTAALAGFDQDTFFVGLGARVRVLRTVYLVGEVSPRMTGYAPGDPAYGFGIEKRVGGHVFQLNFTNTTSTTYGQIARGGFPDSLYLGFNLARKFF
jgi:Membrane bound beta barrel domain (DUF5777)